MAFLFRLNKKGVIYYLGWLLFLNVVFIISTLIWIYTFNFSFYLMSLSSGGLSFLWCWIENQRMKEWRLENYK